MTLFNIPIPAICETLIQSIVISDMGEITVCYKQDMCIEQVTGARLGPMIVGNELPIGKRIHLKIGPMP